MSFKHPLLTLGLALSAATFNAQATLTPYNPNGVDLVYSSVSDITWTKDANLLGTMMSTQGFNIIVNAIITASPTINDTPNVFDTPANSGHHNVSASDFSSSSLGRTSWFGAQAFINYLNNKNYGGSNLWRLPSAGINPQLGYYQTGSELGQLFYSELGGIGGSGIPNTPTFNNEQSAYWSGTEFAIPHGAWIFNTFNGSQDVTNKGFQFSAWAVSPGQVAPVPVPGAVWLFGSGMIGMLGLKRRRNIG